MKKALHVAIFTVAITLSQSVYAAWNWVGTISDWETNGPIEDGDKDMYFTWGGLTGDLSGKESPIGVEFREVELANEDFYTVSFDFDGGFIDGIGTIFYNMTSIGDEKIYSARLDTDVAGGVGELVETDIKNSATGLSILQLVSLNGSPDPQSGHYHFAGVSSIDIINTLNTNGGIIDHVDNDIDVHAVPEPMSLSLIMIGFILFGLSRRNELEIAKLIK